MAESKKAGGEGGGGASSPEYESRLAEAQDKGYFGEVTDPTPNENYTVAGDQLPTPETDQDMAEAAAKLQGRFSDKEKARREDKR